MKTIDLDEYGSNIQKTILIHNIKTIETLTYNTGETVTVIVFMDSTDLHVIQSVDQIKFLIND